MATPFEAMIWKPSPYTIPDTIARSKARKLLMHKVGDVLFVRSSTGEWFEFMMMDGRTVYKSAAKTFRYSNGVDASKPSFYCETGGHMCDLKFMVIVTVDHYQYTVCDECINMTSLDALRAKGYRIRIVSGLQSP